MRPSQSIVRRRLRILTVKDSIQGYTDVETPLIVDADRGYVHHGNKVRYRSTSSVGTTQAIVLLDFSANVWGTENKKCGFTRQYKPMAMWGSNMGLVPRSRSVLFIQ